MIQTIFFDLDNTLLDFNRAEAAALGRALEEAGIPPTAAIAERYHAINLSQWELLEEGVLTRDQVMTRRFDLLFAELGVVRSSREVCRRYEGLLAEGHMLLPGAAALVQALAPRYDLYLATNGAAAVQRRRLRDSGLEPWFRAVFISEEIGWDKPARAFFDACFAAVPGFSRDTALMVGDSLTSDIRGGIGAGIRTCWLRRSGAAARADIRPDHEIASLEELPPLLDRLSRS